MSYVLITLTALSAIFQIDNLKRRPIDKKAWLIVVVLFFSTIISFVIQYQNNENDKYSKDSGIIEGGKVSENIFYVGQGNNFFKVTNGIFDINDYMPELNHSVILKIWFEDNSLKVTTNVNDTLGHPIAKMVRNEWELNKNLRFDRNFNDNALEVLDYSTKVIFQIRVIGDHVYLKGIWSATNNRFLVATSMKGDDGKDYPFFATLAGSYSSFENFSPASIQPIFKYPSDRHEGELVNQ